MNEEQKSIEEIAKDDPAKALEMILMGVMMGQATVKEEDEPEYYGNFDKAQKEIDKHKLSEDDK
jgi:hypothetical protein